MAGLAGAALMTFTLSANDHLYAQSELSLGGYPVCEASAAALVDCPDGEADQCLLVGDNEKEKHVYLYGVDADNGEFTLTKLRKFALKSLLPVEEDKKFRIEDIEAIAPLSNGEVVIYGSHSTNKACKIKNQRLRFAQGRLDTDGIAQEDIPPVQSHDLTCEALFGEDRDMLQETVCKVIESGEAQAEFARQLEKKSQKEAACSAAAALNLEGAVAVSDRVWIGLRAPLVGGWAVLLRQVEARDAFAFDAVALLDMNGNGVRELTLADETIWAIAGPAVDRPEKHALWRFDAGELTHGARIRPVHAGPLPASSEGLAIHQGHALVLIDGEKSDQDGAEECLRISTYTVRKLLQ